MNLVEGVYMFTLADRSDEDLIAVRTVLGLTPMIVTHRTGDEKATRRRVNEMRQHAIKASAKVNTRVELIYIGPTGREHVDWVEPDE